MTSVNSPSFLEKIQFRLRIFYEILTDVNFTKVIPVKDLGLDPKKVFKCSPSTIKYLYIVLDYLKINKKKKILDIGCGKGSVIKFFKEQGCKKVDGLEISKILHNLCSLILNHRLKYLIKNFMLFMLIQHVHKY